MLRILTFILFLKLLTIAKWSQLHMRQSNSQAFEQQIYIFRKLSICTYLSITFTFSIHQHISSENRYCDIPNVRLHRKYSYVIFDLIRSNLIDNLDCSYKLHVVFQTGEHYLVYVIRNMLNKNMKLINTNMYSTYYIMAKQQQIMS